jgi:hypothetical protein
MKSLITLSAVFFISFSTLAQGTNLEYSETKLIQLQGPLSIDGIVSTQTFIIPEGQTWKIETANSSYKYTPSSATSYGFSSALTILLNDMILQRYDGQNTFAFPMWLPAGTYTFTFWSDSTWTAGQYMGYATVTALVFNITP